MLDRKAPLHLWKHLSSFSKMCFVSGPRQSGKTTFVQNIIQPQYHISQYHNWDNHEDKLQLLNDPYWFQKKDNIHNKATCLIFDEIHKYPDWKNYLKGVYDSFHTTHDIIVSGSGRLDIFQKAGDSLAGRYLLMNLYPLTFIDFVDPNSIEPLFLKPFQTMYNKDNIEIWKNFMTFGSFPEMFAKQSESFSRLWSANYTKQLIFEDIRDMTALRNMAKLDILFQLLVSKVANPLSINNIAQSLGVQFQTAQQWIEVIEHYFLVFQITPWSKNLNRSIRKEKKCYLMDIFHLKNQSIRFENLIALELFGSHNVANTNGIRQLYTPLSTR